MILKTFEHAGCLGFGLEGFLPDITIETTTLLPQRQFQFVAIVAGQLVLSMLPLV
jgi:hypothetical protein